MATPRTSCGFRAIIPPYWQFTYVLLNLPQSVIDDTSKPTACSKKPDRCTVLAAVPASGVVVCNEDVIFLIILYMD